MKLLTEAEMEKIFEDGSAHNLNPTHKKQFMNFMFGEEFMEAEDKGSLKFYEKDES